MTLRPIILLLAALFVASGISAARASANDPGPSLDLFNNHYYHCKTDYYVAPGGSDSNPGTASSPWKTLQGANNNLAAKGSTAPGVCVRVAPGTYDGVELSVGGNLASAGGYVVYRCTTLDACTVKGDAGYHSAESFETVWPGGGRTPPNYIMVDGFVLAGGNVANNGVGVSVFNGDNGAELSAHHIWVLNSVVTGFGQAGVGIAAGEYFYIIHDKIYGNSNLGCGVQGSGISFNILHTVPNYTPTADDKTNPDKLLGPTWVKGNSFFHVVVEWNVVFNNALTQCGTQNNPTDTDGNGIIFDTNLEHFVNGVNQG
ncbi:MAG TPA: hypothetical protein VMB71_02725, partial [Acetobacteraceae bacterium]|nr:hypothetical protein [Acetobacteraceae bacterium]